MPVEGLTPTAIPSPDQGAVLIAAQLWKYNMVSAFEYTGKLVYQLNSSLTLKFKQLSHIKNSTDHFDALLHKNIYSFRKRVYDIENNFIKCTNTCINIFNGPMWSRWVQALHCVQW